MLAGGAGAGHGPNFALYPPEVTEVVAVEPDATMRAAAASAASAARVPVTVVAGHADSLPVEDGEADAIVFSLVLCMVPEQARTLAEAARVLRRGGDARFYEHVRDGESLDGRDVAAGRDDCGEYPIGSATDPDADVRVGPAVRPRR
ncbi:MAG TPA: class I SAM-dependent methyltransferase [Streptosporangiaceae bacterium]|nr:class I SAM-dependent methyltransferase [Streptosporangiaceae bacterium]